MARPMRESPALKGADAFNFEMRRLEVEPSTVAMKTSTGSLQSKAAEPSACSADKEEFFT